MKLLGESSKDGMSREGQVHGFSLVEGEGRMCVRAGVCVALRVDARRVRGG